MCRCHIHSLRENSSPNTVQPSLKSWRVSLIPITRAMRSGGLPAIRGEVIPTGTLTLLAGGFSPCVHIFLCEAHKSPVRLKAKVRLCSTCTSTWCMAACRRTLQEQTAYEGTGRALSSYTGSTIYNCRVLGSVGQLADAIAEATRRRLINRRIGAAPPAGQVSGWEAELAEAYSQLRWQSHSTAGLMEALAGHMKRHLQRVMAHPKRSASFSKAPLLL